MATAVPRLQDETYVNWCRSSLALLFLKEGLEEFTDKRVSDFHDELHTRVPQPYSRNGPIDPQQSQQQTSPCMQICKTCTSNEVQRHNYTWRVRCSSKVCSTWMKHIILHHVDNPNPNIERSNLKPQLWPSHPWEVAKCFLPYGCEHVNSAKDADVAAILKLMRTCLFMSNFTNHSMLFEQVLDIRNRLMHSHNLSISDDQLQHDTTKMIDLLNSLVDLSPEETQIIQHTIDNISKLQSKTMEVTANRELVALNTRMQAVPRELLNLKHKCSEYDKIRLDLKSISDALKALDQDQNNIQAEIHQLIKAKERFEDFLQKNGLIQNIAGLSLGLKELDERCDQQDQRLELQDKRLDTQDKRWEHHKHQTDHKMVHQSHIMDNQAQRLDQQHELINEQAGTLDQHNQLIDKQAQRLDQHDQLMDKQAQRIDYQNTRIDILEEQAKSKSDGSGATSCKSWDEQCNDLQQYLHDVYWNTCLWKNPMTNEEEDIFQMYVKPSVKFIKEKDEYGGLTEVREQLLQSEKSIYENIFHSKLGLCKNVYITGDAGTGKTMLCNHMVLTWCKAVQTIQNGTDSSEYPLVLSYFKFLFYLNLRNTEATYHIEDMIKEQLLYDTSTYLDVSELLRTEKCLVVLDGLDEWPCPDNVKKCPGVHKGIPGRNITNKTCVFLTTTRNWKFDTIDLKTKDIDKHVELCGIDEDASNELVQKITHYLDRKSQTGRNVGDFHSEIERKKLDNFLTVPVLLIQLVTLWHYGKDLGNSQLQLYCNMLDLLFEHSEKNLPKKTTQSINKPAVSQNLPGCFSTKEHCGNQIELILCLAKLAYKALFNIQREEALVFKSSQLDIFGISTSEVNLCLQCGILSENKDYHNYTGRYKKYSFVHKKIQEFLASLQIVTFDNVENVIDDIKEFCDSLDIMLEMSQVWMFVAGIRPDITRHILTHLTDVAAADKQVRQYRQTLDGEELIRDILKCVADCVTEGDSNGHSYEINCLEDFYITGANIGLVDTLLSCTQNTKVKSVFINTNCLLADQLIDITSKLRQCNSVQKLHLHDPDCCLPDITVETLVHNKYNTLTCLDVCYATISHELLTAICSSQSLVALGLGLSQLTHRNKEHVVNSVLKSTTIRELRLVLPCSKHRWQCRVRIDLSEMQQLQTLGLWCMSVENLQTLSHSVQLLRLERVTLPVIELCEFARKISHQRHEVRVKLNKIRFTVSNDRHVNIESFIKSCDGLVVKKCDHKSDDTWSIMFQTKIR